MLLKTQIWGMKMSEKENNFVEMPTLTMSPVRKKGLPKGVVILAAAIMLLGLIFMAAALISTP